MITGAAGQLGHELQRTAPVDTVMIATCRRDIDLTDGPAVREFVRLQRPDVIVNAAAFTAVDRAELESATAIAVNAAAAAALAESAATVGARMIQLSTDFVFGGARSHPWRIDDVPAPLSVYGASKYDGERAVLNTLGSRALVLRTAWLYSAHGSNFVKTMLRLMRGHAPVRVVADQVGTPTWARSLAMTVWRAVCGAEVTGVLHWTDGGSASWYEFAVAIQTEALHLALLSHAVPVHPISTTEYPTPAKRPSYSVLDVSETVRQLGVVPDHWRTNLRLMLQELTHA